MGNLKPVGMAKPGVWIGVTFSKSFYMQLQKVVVQ
jgi:hypothetical protein